MHSDLTFDRIRSALDRQELFERKTWRLSPTAWPLTSGQVADLQKIGEACFEFFQALETLYFRSLANKNLLRNKPLRAPWVAEYLDRGKPAELLAHGRHERLRGALPVVMRPDLLLTADGFALTELDSVPGGIGLTGYLNRLFSAGEDGVIGAGDRMLEEFYSSLAALVPDKRSPLIALVVSEEAATYRPEMQWLAEELQRLGRRVFCLRPEEVFPLGGAVFFDIEGVPEKIDVVYRFFELFDWENVPCAPFILEAWENGEVAVAPPMRTFQEEKLALALFHHHLLRDFWEETMSAAHLRVLRGIIPSSWVLDPAPLPPSAVLDGPRIGGRPIWDWRQLAQASQKERDLIIKISGYHATAWGARSVVLGSDCSREDWQEAVRSAIELSGSHLHILQEYRKPIRIAHPVFDAEGRLGMQEGRLRLCPYFFQREGSVVLAGALATFCPPDKKIIHGMQDAALLPARVTADGR